MFIHIFTYRLKCLFRDKEMVFWTLFFPLILATFFSLAFGKLNDEFKFKPINIAVVNNDAYASNEDFSRLLNGVSMGEDRLFNLTKTSEAEAGQLLTDGDVEAYILLNPKAQMIVRKTGINQNIVKIFLEQYEQTTLAATNIFSTNTQNMNQVIKDLTNRIAYTKQVSSNKAEPNVILNYFYSLVAMACIYGSFWGAKEVTDIQADLSARASRINMSPIHKLKTFLFSLTASILIQFAEILVLLGYLRFIIHIDFGSKTGYVLLTSLVGTIVGITFGAFISAMVKKGEGVKTAILISVTMLCSFLSGMMYDKMKYIIAQNVPVLSYINPVNLLTDAFYSLYYYDTYHRYWLNMGALGIFILLFCFGTYWIIRRQKYVSL